MIQKITKDEILKEKYNLYFRKKVETEFTIAHQKKLDPNEMSAQKILSRGSDGRPTSTREIKRSEYISILEKELDDVNLILGTIKEIE